MKKITVGLLVILLLSPVPTYAAPSAGIKPSSFFYFIDTGLEKLNLIFIFNAEKKANKALEYAEERLLEVKEEAEDNKPKGVEEAIEGYEANISLATEKSKELENESDTEALLNTISSNTLKHQEVLKNVYDQVSEEAKGAILKAIEASHKKQEEAVRQIGALKKEVAQLQDEIGELQRRLEEKNKEQKPSPTPSQKQGNEIKKPTQTPVPPTVTPTSDKSLRELREELERKLRELEKTPMPTPTISATPIYTFSPTHSTPTPIPSISTPPSPTPVSVILTTKEFLRPGEYATYVDSATNAVKSITLEVYRIDYPQVAGTPEPIWGTETKEGIPEDWKIYVNMDTYDPNCSGSPGTICGHILFKDLLVTSNPMSVSITKPIFPQTRISYGISCNRDQSGNCKPEPNLLFKITSADGAKIVYLPIPKPTSTPTPSVYVTPSSAPVPTPVPKNASLTVSGVFSLDEESARSLIGNNREIFSILKLVTDGDPVTIKSMNITFLNSDSSARLQNVYTSIANNEIISAVEPGMSVTFNFDGGFRMGTGFDKEKIISFSAKGHSYGGNTYSITDVSGWQLRITSIKTCCIDGTNKEAQISGVPLLLTAIPRDISISLMNTSPAGLQSQNSIRPMAVRAKISTTYPLIKITGFKVRGIGKSVSSNGTETSIINFQILQATQWKGMSSGGNVVITSSTSEMSTIYQISGPENELTLILDVYDKYYPGTSWKFTIEDITLIDHKGSPITLSGLPVTGHEIHW